MMSSLTSGLASRETWTAFAPAERLVEAYMPITGYAVLGAGLPSLVIRVIGTSIAIVWTLVPLNRFTPKGLESSLASSFLLSTGGNRRRLTVSNTAPRSMAKVSARCPANTLAPVPWSSRCPDWPNPHSWASSPARRSTEPRRVFDPETKVCDGRRAPP